MEDKESLRNQIIGMQSKINAPHFINEFKMNSENKEAIIRIIRQVEASPDCYKSESELKPEFKKFVNLLIKYMKYL